MESGDYGLLSNLNGLDQFLLLLNSGSARAEWDADKSLKFKWVNAEFFLQRSEVS